MLAKRNLRQTPQCTTTTTDYGNDAEAIRMALLKASAAKLETEWSNCAHALRKARTDASELRAMHERCMAHLRDRQMAMHRGVAEAAQLALQAQDAADALEARRDAADARALALAQQEARLLREAREARREATTFELKILQRQLSERMARREAQLAAERRALEAEQRARDAARLAHKRALLESYGELRIALKLHQRVQQFGARDAAALRQRLLESAHVANRLEAQPLLHDELSGVAGAELYPLSTCKAIQMASKSEFALKLKNAMEEEEAKEEEAKERAEKVDATVSTASIAKNDHDNIKNESSQVSIFELALKNAQSTRECLRGAYKSPLRTFHSYRLSPHFVRFGVDRTALAGFNYAIKVDDFAMSSTRHGAHLLNPMAPLCAVELQYGYCSKV